MGSLRILSICVILLLIPHTVLAHLEATEPFASPVESPGNGTAGVCQKCYNLSMECLKCTDDGRHACVAENYKGVCCGCIGTGPGSRCLLCASGTTCTRSTDTESGYYCFSGAYLSNLYKAMNVTSFPEPMETKKWERYPGLMVGYFFLGAGLAIPLPIFIFLVCCGVGYSIDHPGSGGGYGSWDNSSSSWDFSSSGGGFDSGGGGGGGGGDSGASYSFSAD